jgi:hypothetical protein
VRERDVEYHLRTRVEREGGICYKFASPGRRGVPDRIVLLRGVTVFVEVKAPGEKTTKQQDFEINRMRRVGAFVVVVDSKESVNNLMSAIP